MSWFLVIHIYDIKTKIDCQNIANGWAGTRRLLLPCKVLYKLQFIIMGGYTCNSSWRKYALSFTKHWSLYPFLFSNLCAWFWVCFSVLNGQFILWLHVLHCRLQIVIEFPCNGSVKCFGIAQYFLCHSEKYKLICLFKDNASNIFQCLEIQIKWEVSWQIEEISSNY